jgi:hypothetical protein
MADTAITIPAARVSTISEQGQASFGFNYKATLKYTDLNTSTTSGATDTVTVTLGATPAKWYVSNALVNITTAFTGITGATINVGTTTSTVALIASTSVLTAAVLPMVSTVPILTNATATASKNLVAVFTAAGTGGPAGLTAGQLDIYLRILDSSAMP